MSELTRLDALAWGKQKDALGLSRASVPYFNATGAGAANGTTIVSSELTGVFDADYKAVGLLVEVIYAANGPSGEHGGPIRARVIDYDSATGTLTVEALPWQTSEDDSFALLDPPHAWASEDTGAASTTVSDADRAEDDDYWNGSAEQGGPYTHIVNSALIGATVQSLVTDFGSGDFTVADMGANTTAADLIEFLQWPEVMGGLLKLNIPKADREGMVGSFGKLRGVAAPRTVNGNLECYVRGPGRSRVGDPAELDTPLGAICEVTAAPSDATVDAGAAVNSIPTSAGSPAIGEMYITEFGDVFMCENVAGGTITPSPNLRTVPPQGSTLYGLRLYTPATALQYAMFIRQWYGLGLVEDLWGLVPQPSFSFERGAIGKCTLAFVGADGYRRHLTHGNANYSRSIRAKLPTVTPRHIGAVRANVDAVELELRTASLDMGIETALRENLNAPNWTDGLDLLGDGPNGQCQIWLDADGKTLLRKYREGRACRFLLQCGTVPGDPGVVAFWSHEAELRSDDINDDSGRRTVPAQWRTTEDPTRSSSLPRWALAIG